MRSRYAPRGARPTFSEHGEDIVISDILSGFGIKKAFYLDIGAHHPVFSNNTYLFYRKGGEGVLIEPNPEICRSIERKRPRDLCLNAGVGAKDGSAVFFSFPRTTRSTFSADQAKSWQDSSGQKAVAEDRRIISLDTILHDHCKGRTPDVVSIDAEGYDAEILSGFSWKVRPLIFCVESADGISGIMERNGYVLKAQIFQNVIFVDGK